MSSREIEPMRSYPLAPTLVARGAWVETMTVARVKEQQMRAELKRMYLRGEIAEAGNLRYVDADGQLARGGRAGFVAVDIVRLKRSRLRRGWYAIGVGAALGAMAGLGMLIYASRHVLLAMLMGTAVLAFLLAKLAGHGGTCLGIHCSGCRG